MLSSITALQLFSCRVSLRTTWYFLRMSSNMGLTGWGECSDAGDGALLAECLAQVGPALLGSPIDPAALESDLLALRAASPDARRKLRWATVLGALDQAACDLAAQAEGMPLWRWLGGAERGPVPLYANINRAPGAAQPGPVAAAAVADGFAAVKCAPFDAPPEGRASLADTGLARVRAVREAVGPTVRLMVDCHHHLPFEDIVRLMPRLEELDIYWLEDAVAIEDVGALRRLRQLTRRRLAGGELVFEPAIIAAAASPGLLDVIMPDVKHAGGIRRAVALAQSACQAEISPHNPSGPIGTAASLHLAAACPKTTMLEVAFGEVPWRSELAGGAEVIAGGQLAVPHGPGLGVALDSASPRLSLIWSI